MMLNAWDRVEVVRRHRDGCITFRVQREEVTTEDKYICPQFYAFQNVVPFIIRFDLNG